MAKQRRMVGSGILVTLKGGCYWRDRSCNMTYTGPSGRPGSAKYRPGSGPFRVPEHIWLRQEGLPATERIFIKVGEAEDAHTDA